MLQNPNTFLHFSDEELFLMVREGNTNAFTEIYNRYMLPLVNTAYKPLQSLVKAQDIVQDIFISLYLKKDILEFSVSLKSYLYKALKFKVLNELRSMNIREAYRKNEIFSDICKNDFADKLELGELNVKIERTVGELPPKCRDVFMLSRNEECSYKQISINLNISVSTVEKHMVKALKVIKGKLKDSN